MLSLYSSVLTLFAATVMNITATDGVVISYA